MVDHDLVQMAWTWGQPTIQTYSNGFQRWLLFVCPSSRSCHPLRGSGMLTMHLLWYIQANCPLVNYLKTMEHLTVFFNWKIYIINFYGHFPVRKNCSLTRLSPYLHRSDLDISPWGDHVAWCQVVVPSSSLARVQLVNISTITMVTMGVISIDSWDLWMFMDVD